MANHPIPVAALSSHIAILGKTGSGKTYAAKGIVEDILSVNGRVCIIDPTGAWHGLRSSATGKSAGFPVVIFGGSHADLPLGGAHGEAIAEIVGTASDPAILDTSLMRVGERTRFFADFADALVRKNKGPLHLVIDEAHLFAPQGKVNDPQSGAMLHAANNLVSLGRSRGLRIMLITQRPAKLHKDSLTQVETLVALRLIAPQDRAAVEAWIKDNADEKRGREIIESLATLKTGQGWVWAPELRVLERVTFPKIKTFDSSQAPDGEVESGAVLARIDKEAIQKRLEVVAADAVANDPARLKAEVAKLKRDLAAKPTALPVDEAAIERRGYQRGWEEGVQVTKASLTPKITALAAALDDLRSFGPPPASRVPFIPARQPHNGNGHARPTPPARATSIANDSNLPLGERAVLTAAAQYEGVDRDQLSVLTGYKRSSRDAYIQRLREKGLVDISGQTVKPTDAGRAALGSDYAPLPIGADLQTYWNAKLPEGERKILAALIEAFPDAIERSSLDDATGYKRSSRDAYIQRLKSRRLVTTHGSDVRASETLF